MNQASGVIKSNRIGEGWFTCSQFSSHRQSNQRYEFTLSIGVAVDVALSGLD